MIVFLTSSPCSNQIPKQVSIPCILNEANKFVSQLSKNWKINGKALIISSDPNNFELNDEMADTFWRAFSFHGLSLQELAICDARNEADIQELVEESDVMILAGGHVPTQNAFFKKIRLREQIQNFEGLVIGISAGTMNCAELVYAQPELEGESLDPDYKRFLPGLGLTNVMILPHYQEVKDSVLDGKRVFEEITYPDSMGRTFYALIDGSYLLIQNGRTKLYGEAYCIQDGCILQVCREGDSLVLEDDNE